MDFCPLFNVPDSVNSIVLGVSRATQIMEENPSLRLIQIDMKNAFNSLRRDSILIYLGSHLPSLLPWANWSLCNPSELYWEQHTLSSTTGIQQGDPLGPLLFACGIQPILESLRDNFPEATSWWYLNDGNILVSADQTPRIFERLALYLHKRVLSLMQRNAMCLGWPLSQ